MQIQSKSKQHPRYSDTIPAGSNARQKDGRHNLGRRHLRQRRELRLDPVGIAVEERPVEIDPRHLEQADLVDRRIVVEHDPIEFEILVLQQAGLEATPHAPTRRDDKGRQQREAKHRKQRTTDVVPEDPG